jgi:hypothetical protein
MTDFIIGWILPPLMVIVLVIMNVCGYMTKKGYDKYVCLSWGIMAIYSLVKVDIGGIIIYLTFSLYHGYKWWKNRKDDDWTDKGNKPKRKRSRNWVPKLKNPEPTKSVV